MSKSLDAAVLALLATLEERAKKNGEKSIIKSVVGRLTDAGASSALISEISALRTTKAAPAKSAAEPKTTEKAPEKTNGKANGKAKPAVAKTVDTDAPEVPAVVG